MLLGTMSEAQPAEGGRALPSKQDDWPQEQKVSRSDQGTVKRLCPTQAPRLCRGFLLQIPVGAVSQAEKNVHKCSSKCEVYSSKMETVQAAAARQRALLLANEEEDREIRKLERRLGWHKRRKKGDGGSVPLSFARDGLGYILGALEPRGGLGGLGDGDSGGEEEAAAAGRHTRPGSDPGSEEEEEEEEEDEARGESAPKRVRFADEEESQSSSEDEDTSQSSSEEDEDDAPSQESPCEPGRQYIPPQVRLEEEGTGDVRKKEELERLKKQVKGLINRLSEPNMASISGQLEELYMTHSRKDMNDTLTAALMGACVTATAMPSRLMMEHVLLVSILHHTVGIEVGAGFLEAVVRKFDDVYKNGGEDKECDNLFTIVAHLYNFHVVQSLLVFDILKKLIGTFTEKDIELILLMLKNVGSALRKDDPLALKELITEAQAKASGAGGRFQDQTRIRFMLETMLALKNNDMRKIPGYDPEPVEKLRKLQRALVRSAGSGSETQLRVSWDGILNAEQTGRWWIVGSAWSGAPMIDSSHQTHLQKPLAGKWLFVCCRLGLKEQQEREVVHVLMDCCLQEKTYNPFYAFLASKFCSYERRFQNAALMSPSRWSEGHGFGSGHEKVADGHSHYRVAWLQGAVPAPGGCATGTCCGGHSPRSPPTPALAVVEFSELDKPRVHFLQKVLTIVLMETEVEDLGLIFAKVSENPKLGVLRESLKLFIGHFLLKHVQAHQSAEEASELREKAGLATKSLQGKAMLRM
ncbi:PREDICTED: nucleolar MIF4G domain-containing protein 1 [Dipodomys ordii]|uniref:Nucleolar MIF4G domain-containing protein 1 n=1 Tax=Dipodomys ordii TaxID=10020 RepID=A0A1S3G1H3_DIPOR|nr:PREDICTED: nucleolar MIF4G domain-containing protein 1 [Dipodomys ordii]